MKPFIGVTCGFSGEDAMIFNHLRATYTKEIKRAGGIPVILPLEIHSEDAEEYVSKLDGILFTGGGDISPHLFDEDPIKELGGFISIRDVTEFELMKAAQKLGVPVFGICRGCQVINVVLGGTLYQDIPKQLPDAIGHSPRNTAHYEPFHKITIEPGDSRISRVIKKQSIMTNSFHHQSVKQLAPGLRVTAKTSDGIIEAYEGTDPGWYVHSVQFHPETMSERHPEFREFFTEFVNACRDWAKNRK